MEEKKGREEQAGQLRPEPQPWRLLTSSHVHTGR